MEICPPHVTGTSERFASGTRLVADIGGTNARFGWQANESAAITDVRLLPCADYLTLAEAMHSYLTGIGRGVPTSCAMAIATPVLGDQITMTNHHWAFSKDELRRQFRFDRLLILNDFTALAMALPALKASELSKVGGSEPLRDHAIALIGAGTGLGVSGLIPVGDSKWVPLTSEGGHVTLAANDARENAVLAELARRFGHVSAERAVSGRGLVELYRALFALDGLGTPDLTVGPSEITLRAMRGNPVCREALQLFCAFLGTVAGNLALTLGAQGGVYIGGGIVPQLGDWFSQSPFRNRFETKGRFSAYLTAIPVFVIHSRHSPALLGAARALDAQR